MSSNVSRTEQFEFPMLKRLVEVNGEFERSIKDLAHAVLDDKSIVHYVLFGTPGEGKSTLVARLRSELTAPQFMQIITRRGPDRDFDNVEGVVVGHKFGATTLFPCVWSVPHNNKVRLVDMPGFTDTDAVVRVIVDVHNHAFLKVAQDRNARCRYLIVVGAPVFDEANLTRVVDKYYRELHELFGADFAKFLNACVFVITKNDTTKYTVDDIKRRARAAVNEANEIGNSTLAMFLSQLAACHVVVDYERDTAESLLAAIEAKTCESNATMSIVVRSVSRQTEVLCDACVRELRRLQQQVKSDSVYFETQIQDHVTGRVRVLAEQVTTHLRNTAKMFEWLKHSMANLSVAQQALASHELTVSRAAATTESLRKEVDDLKHHLAMLEGRVDDRCVEAYAVCPTETPRGPFGSYKVDVIVEKPADSLSVVVVVVNDAQMAEFRKMVGCDDSLVPPSADVLDNISPRTCPAVLFSSQHPQLGGDAFAVRQVTETTLRCQLKAGVPFSAVVYTVYPRRATPAYKELVDELTSMKNAKEAQLKTAEQKQAGIEQQKKQNADTMRQLTPELLTLQQQLEAARTTNTTIAESLEAYLPELSRQCSDVSESRGAASLTLVGELCAILRRYGLSHDSVTSEVQNLRTAQQQLSAVASQFFGGKQQNVHFLRQELAVKTDIEKALASLAATKASLN